MLLESIKNGVDQCISTLPNIKIDEEVFKNLQKLINEWYKVDLPYLNQELKGSEIDVQEKDIGWIDSYFSKYTLDAFSNILDLRLKNLELNNIKTLPTIFIDQEHNNIVELLFNVVNTKVQTTLVPLNLFNNSTLQNL